jgi:hypothetical protein
MGNHTAQYFLDRYSLSLNLFITFAVYELLSYYLLVNLNIESIVRFIDKRLR